MLGEEQPGPGPAGRFAALWLVQKLERKGHIFSAGLNPAMSLLCSQSPEGLKPKGCGSSMAASAARSEVLGHLSVTPSSPVLT